MTTAHRLDRIGLNVRDLDAATAFYVEALGFTAATPRDADPAMARLLGAQTMQVARMGRGRQVMELAATDPPGAPYPPDSHSNDAWFQHCALVTDDIAADHARLARHAFTPISRHGPQKLPGGIVAFKFRDPDGHPLELIQFPSPDRRTAGGIDHSAIVVSDVDRTIGFYTARLGLAVQARKVNAGPAQAALDDLDGPTVDVVALAPAEPAPHVELLGYRTPRGRTPRPLHLHDIAAARLVFATASPLPGAATTVLSDGTIVTLLRDPDGHVLLLEQEPQRAQD